MKMNNESDNKTDSLIKQLEDHLKETLPDDCIRVSLYITATGHELVHETRTAESLKKAGVSMRNLRGEFIK